MLQDHEWSIVQCCAWLPVYALQILLALNVSTILVAASKCMRAVKLCTNNIVQFLTGGAGQPYIMVLKRWMLLLMCLPMNEWLD